MRRRWPAGPGTTELFLTHERFVVPARIAGHEKGWTQVLTRLDHHVTEESA